MTIYLLLPASLPCIYDLAYRSGITQLFGLSGKYWETTSLSRGVLHQGSVDLSPGFILLLSKDTRFIVAGNYFLFSCIGQQTVL
jgi:hypothetical protein